MPVEEITLPEIQKVYKCPSCSNNMVFDITTQTMKCPNCGQEKKILPATNAVICEYDFNEHELARADVDWDEQVQMIRCQSCGADLSVSRTATTVSCAFCGSANILEIKQKAGIRPEAIIPFKVNKNAASEIFRKWIGGRFFAPNALKKMYQEDKVQAIYVPYWTYDAQTESAYTAMGGEVYYVTVRVGNQTRQERRVNWYPVSGRISRFFDDVLVNAGGENTRLVSQIDQYRTDSLVPFSTEYLSGFMAEKYVLNPKSGFEFAKSEMHNALVGEAQMQVLTRYDLVQSISIDTSYSHVKFKHVLFPVWSSGFMFKDKLYNYVINGFSGQIAGKYPLSPVKVTIAVVLVTIVVVLLLILYMNNS